MKRLIFPEMQFSRSSEAWCPVTGKNYGVDTPRVVTDKILSSVGTIPTYYKFPASQGYVRYDNEVGCYDRAGSTHVYSDELDALETRLTGYPLFARGDYGGGDTSEDGHILEYLSYGDLGGSLPFFLVTSLIHGDEADGILGTLKAFEILVTHPDFAPLRAQYTIAFLPCCNPDGYFNGVRNLSVMGPHPSGVDQPINLNRVWPWFWEGFVPTADESKGYGYLGPVFESDAMNAFRLQLPIAWALDQHATAGDGARYVSRDRNFRYIAEADQEKVWADWNIYRLLKAMQAKRVQEDAQPDLWINYYRSAWRPHWHSYLGTLDLESNGDIQAVSLVGEHNKVPNQVITSDLETYQSASNYNLDHVLAMALMAQGGVIERKTAVLVEHETGVNIASNSKFENWRDDAYRPDYWTGERGFMSGTYRSECHMEGPGRPIMFTPQTGGLSLSYGIRDSVLVPADGFRVAILGSLDREITLSNVFYTWDGESTPTLIFQLEKDDLDGHSFGGNIWLGDVDTSSAIYAVGSGRLLTEMSELDLAFYKYTLSAGVWSLSTILTHTSPLVDAGAQLDTNEKDLYIFGGLTAAATPSRKIHKADCVAETFTEVGTNLLGATGWYGMGSCYCSGGDLSGKIVLVGSNDVDDGMTKLKVRVFAPTGPTLTEYLVDVPITLFDTALRPMIYHCGVCYDGTDTIWVYGGENPATGLYYYKTFSMTWNGTGFDEAVEHPLKSGLMSDSYPDDYASTEYWNLGVRGWRAFRRTDAETGTVSNTLVGGDYLDDPADLPSWAVPLRDFYAHYLADDVMSAISDYDYGYLRYSTHFDISAYDKAVTSWSYKVDPNLAGNSTATSAYVRLNNSPGDSGAGDLATRRQRTYYLHPPRDWWWREHAAIDFTMASPDTTEDEWRTYLRSYQPNQTILADAPMVQTGTLWPSSWSPSGMTRSAEGAVWEDAVDNRFYRVKFDWLPSSSFLAATNGIFPLFVIGDTESSQDIIVFVTMNYLDTRSYYRDGVIGPAEPQIMLQFTDGDLNQNISLPVFWGGYVKDAAIGKFESPIQIEVWHHVRHGVGLIVRNGWAEGHVKLAARSEPAMWSSTGDVLIIGGGWWSEPETLPLDIEWKRKYLGEDNPNGALLIGDRDPTFGQVSSEGCFRYTEIFTRADDPNLGDDWNVIQQTGAGFNIYSNTARCSELGWERWDAYPYVRDCSVFANVGAPDGCKVGLFTRMHWGMAAKGFVHGFAGYLECTSATTADLVIASKFWAAGVQDETELIRTEIVYTAGSVVTLELEAVGTTITLRAGVLGTSCTSSAHPLPGAFGIMGETTGSGVYVWVDAVYAELRGGLHLRITE